MAYLTPGNYVGVAKEFEFGKSKNKGTPFVSVRFQIAEGEDEGKTVDWTGYFTPATKERTIQSLRYAGWSGNDLTDLQGLGKNKVQLVVNEEKYTNASGEDKSFMRVNFVNRIGTKRSLASDNALTSDDIRQLSASLSMEIDSTPVETSNAVEGFSQAARAGDDDFPV